MDRAMTDRKPRVEHDASVTAPDGSTLSHPASPPDAAAAAASTTPAAASPVAAPCGARRKRRPKFVL